MKLLAIYGSPRKGGVTDTLLDMFIEGMEGRLNLDVAKIYIRELKIEGCRECYKCRSNGGICVIDDDMQMVYRYLEEADIIVLSAPIFFYNFNAQVKAMVDRIQAFWVRKYILGIPLKKKKIGILISAGATKGENLFDGALLTFKYFLDPLNGEIVGSFTARRLEKPEDAKSKSISNRMDDFVRNIVRKVSP